MFAAPVAAFSPSVVSSPPLSIGGCKQTGELDDDADEDDVDDADADAEEADDYCADYDDAGDDFLDNDYLDDDDESMMITTILTVTISW